MEASVVKSNKSVSLRFQIKKDSLKEIAPEEKNLILIHEMYQCSMCYKIFNQLEELSTHGCPSPKDYIFSDTPSMENFPDIYEPDSEKPKYKCNICDKVFMYPTHLKVHLTIHKKKHKCSECSEEFKNRKLLRIHKKTHKKEKIPCEVCQKKFNSEEELSRHKENVHVVRKWQCHMCDKVCSSKACLAAHFKTHYEKTFSCDLCGRKYSVEKMLDRHYERIHVTKAYQCTYCDKIFMEGGKYTMHVKTHTQPFMCETCGKRFSRKDNLETHILVHIDARPYECSECPKTFKTEKHLQRHSILHNEAAGALLQLKNKNRKVRPYNYYMKKVCCELCGKICRSKQAYQVHYRTHTGEKPFQCEHCNKAFRSKWSLKAHLPIHGEATCYCDVCGKGFTSKYTLKSHLNLHTEKFMCEICGKCFAGVPHLQYHMETHNEEKAYECDVCHRRYTNRWNMAKHKVAAHPELKEAEDSIIIS